jgi:hypothetical protein
VADPKFYFQFKTEKRFEFTKCQSAVEKAKTIRNLEKYRGCYSLKDKRCNHINVWTSQIENINMPVLEVFAVADDKTL